MTPTPNPGLTWILSSEGVNCIAYELPSDFSGPGRGCELESWIHSEELLFPDSSVGFAPSNGLIVGARTKNAWVVFHGLQVIQIVPEEVHSYWHIEQNTESPPMSCFYRIPDSRWLSSFSPHHLQGHSHFVVHFYDEIVELICRELLFATGGFSLAYAIDLFPQLAYAYLRRAMSNEKIGKTIDAIHDYKRYIAMSPDHGGVMYATQCLARIDR